MHLRTLTVLVLLLSSTIALAVDEVDANGVYAPLETQFQKQWCSPPMYAPAAFPIGTGGVGLIAQGNCLGVCTGFPYSTTGDSLFRFSRAANGTWTLPEGGPLPAFSEEVRQVTQVADPCAATNQLTEFTGVFGGPAVVRIGSKIYMAYLKGNADFHAGEVWWAVSSDNGVTWTKQTSQRLLVGFAHRGHQSSSGCPEGFGGLSMTTLTDASGTWFRIYGTYYHPARELGAEYVSFVDYRIKYDPDNTFGLSTQRQLLYNGQYINHSGKLVWTYDAIAPQTGEFKLQPSSVRASWGIEGLHVTRSVTKGPNNVYYMLVEGWPEVPGTPLNVKTSCDTVNWSATPIEIATKAVSDAHPGKVAVANGLYYGTLGAETGFWGFLAISSKCTTDKFPYGAGRIVPVKINIDPRAC